MIIDKKRFKKDSYKKKTFPQMIMNKKRFLQIKKKKTKKTKQTRNQKDSHAKKRFLQTIMNKNKCVQINSQILNRQVDRDTRQ